MQRKTGMKSIQYEENLDGRTADTRWRDKVIILIILKIKSKKE